VKSPYKRASLGRENIFKRDNYSCQYCGKRLTYKSGTIDHIIPQSKGGKHSWDNVVVACWPCNNKKDSKTLSEAGMFLLRKPYSPRWITLVLGSVDASLRASWSRWVRSAS
jgi:5-methylcytosine-specific restriction endonuclease McrA